MKKLLIIPAYCFYCFGRGMLDVGTEEIYLKYNIISVFAIGIYSLQFASYLQDIGNLNGPFVN